MLCMSQAAAVRRYGNNVIHLYTNLDCENDECGHIPSYCSVIDHS